MQSVGPAAGQRESGLIVGSLLVAFVVTFTVTGSLALGITLAYSAVIGLLHAFAYSKRDRKPALVLVPSQTHVSGD
jgi:O-antigen ligase